MKMTLAACMLVKNEEKLIERAIDSVKKVADFIYVLDTGSTDNTLKIAKKNKCVIKQISWPGDFEKAYNELFDFAKADYLFLVDADFVLKKKSVKKLLDLKKKNFENATNIALRFNTQFDENENCYGYILRELIFKKGAIEFKYPVHPIHVPTDLKKYKLLKCEQIEVDHLPSKESRGGRNLQNIELLKKALKMYPEDEYICMMLSSTFFKNEMFTETVEYGKKYLYGNQEKTNFQLFSILEKYLIAFYQINGFKKFKAEHEKLNKKYSTPIFDLVMGDVLAMDGQNKNALKYFYKYIENFKQMDEEILKSDEVRYKNHVMQMIISLTKLVEK